MKKEIEKRLNEEWGRMRAHLLIQVERGNLDPATNWLRAAKQWNDEADTLGDDDTGARFKPQ